MTSISPVAVEPQKVRQTDWKELGLRFLFGGIVTAAVGIIGELFGPAVAGLFLAFPAIAIASLTLLARDEDRPAAGADGLGAGAGSVGLAAFGAIVWASAGRLPGAAVLGIASLGWLVVSLAVWALLDAVRRRGRA